ncbi:hypothetical protein D9M68_965700 [compost metagenome]
MAHIPGRITVNKCTYPCDHEQHDQGKLIYPESKADVEVAYGDPVKQLYDDGVAVKLLVGKKDTQKRQE